MIQPNGSSQVRSSSLKQPTRQINRLSKVPLYQQIYGRLRAKIQNGDWTPGESMPTEQDLINEFAVSRVTIRQVMDRLASEGLIYRQQGRGTFMAEPTLEQGLTHIISFTEEMKRRGLHPETLVLSSVIIPASEDIARALNISPGDEVAFLKRIRLANHEPLCIEESYLVHKMCPGILEDDFALQPLRETLEKKYGIKITRALQKIHAVLTSTETTRLLRTGPHSSALLFIERTSLNDWNTPVEFLRLYFRGDRYSLYSELRD